MTHKVDDGLAIVTLPYGSPVEASDHLTLRGV